MARVASRKSCMKKVSQSLHKKATTKRQHQMVIGKASKSCSRKMRLRRAGKKSVRKPRVGKKSVRKPRVGKKSVRKTSVRSNSAENPGMIPLMSPPMPANEYSYAWYLNEFENASKIGTGTQQECASSALTRALRSESRNLLVGINNEDRDAYEADPRRQNMIRAYTDILDRCALSTPNDMTDARQAIQNV